MNKKQVGDIGEEIAANYLKEKGLKILERNTVLCGVEADIVAKDGKTYVFCEVKTRNNTAFGAPIEAVTPYKQTRYVTFVKAYAVKNRLKNTDFRFAVISITEDGVEHIEGAFFAN